MTISKKYQFEAVEELKTKKAQLDALTKEVEALRKEVDKWTGKESATFTFYGKTLTVLFDNTTTTKTDYKGLFQAFGITDEDKERYTTHTPATRFKAIV